MVVNAVVELVPPTVAHRGDQVVHTHVVADHLVHLTPPVRLETIAGLQVQATKGRPRVSGRQPLLGIVLDDRYEVGDLLAFDVDYLEQGTLRHSKSTTLAGRDVDLRDGAQSDVHERFALGAVDWDVRAIYEVGLWGNEKCDQRSHLLRLTDPSQRD